MPPSLKPILVVSDAHRPYHNQHAWDLMLQVGKALKPSILVTIGDLADMYTVSSHSKDPSRANRLDEELADINLALDQLDALGAKQKVFVEGNHEDRLKRYLQDEAPALFSAINIPKLFRLKERKWEFVPYKESTRIGKVRFTHDIGNAGRFAVHKALDTFQHSVITGHTHRLSYIVEGNAVGEYAVSASFGWLGDVEQIDYMHKVQARKNWTLGFGVGYLDAKTGIMYLTPVPIITVKGVYSCAVNGKLFTVKT